MNYTLAFKKEKNCPAFIDGVIHESFHIGIYDESMEQDWHDAGPDEILAPLPGNLTLITKDKCYDFDFRTAFGGHIVSERFLNALKTMNSNQWEVSRLAILSPKGSPMKTGSYFFIRQRQEDKASADIIDLEKSNIQFRKNGEIKSINSLTIKENFTTDIFSINEISLLGLVFLSPRAADILEKSKLIGVEVIDTKKLSSIERA